MIGIILPYTIIILTLLFFELHYLRHTKRHRLRKRLILWIPCVAMLTFATYLLLTKDFAPRNHMVHFVFLALEGFVFIPLFVYAACSATGHAIRRWFKLRSNYGNVVGLLCVLAIWVALFIGVTSGVTTLRVRYVTYSSDKLPDAFNGYRIVQFSDMHIGSYLPSRHYFVRDVVDSINSQHADLIVFSGDLVNIHPEELYPHIGTLSLLRARDGVVSVNGNHDYSDYLHVDDEQKSAINREIVRLERGMGWNLLQNESHTIYRGEDHIVIAGMENFCTKEIKRYISRGDIAKTMDGVDSTDFVILLQHDPKRWRSDILPQTNAALTLSGHTHGMQVSLFGWSPLSLTLSEWGGYFEEGDRAINVTTGIGGLIPCRFGMPPEIVVITLHKK